MTSCLDVQAFILGPSIPVVAADATRLMRRLAISLRRRLTRSVGVVQSRDDVDLVCVSRLILRV